MLLLMPSQTASPDDYFSYPSPDNKDKRLVQLYPRQLNALEKAQLVKPPTLQEYHTNLLANNNISNQSPIDTPLEAKEIQIQF